MVLVMMETVPKLVCMLYNASGINVQLVLLTPSSSRACVRGARRQVGQLAALAAPSLIVGLIQRVLVMLETVPKSWSVCFAMPLA